MYTPSTALCNINEERKDRPLVNRYVAAAVLRRDFRYAGLLLAAILHDVEFEAPPQTERGTGELMGSHMAPERVQWSS
jgi:hypothetical protein